MSLDYVVTMYLLVFGLLSLFVLRALPIWFWLLLLLSFCLVEQGDDPPLRTHRPRSRHEACNWRCGDRYGKDGRFALSRHFCLEECRKETGPFD